jgi:hypothetical protein
LSRRLFVVVVLILGFVAAASAEKFPDLPGSISIAIFNVDPSLTPRLAALQKERADVILAGEDFDKACAKVVAGSLQDSQCDKYEPVLLALAKTHVEKTKIFLADYAAASAVADRTPLPLPKGRLSKAVEDAITGAYRDAPPGVIGALLRAFEALDARDWPLASSWFKDALRRDPGNPGLKKFLELAQAPAASAAASLPPAPRSDSYVPFLPLNGVRTSASDARTPLAFDVYYFRPNEGYYRMTEDDARSRQLLDAVQGRPAGTIVPIR